MLGEVRAQILAQKMAEGDHMEEVQQHAAAAPAPAAASSAAAHSGGPELVLCQVCWDVPCACKSAGGKRNFQIFADTDPIDLTGATSEDNSAPLTQVAPHTQRHKENNAVSESIVPECWSKVRGEDDSPMAVPLDATNPAHKELWDSIVSHMQEVGDVICIARNEHYDLWESFVQEKRKMLRKLRRSGRWENTPVMTGESSSPESSFPNLRTWNIGSGANLAAARALFLRTTVTTTPPMCYTSALFFSPRERQPKPSFRKDLTAGCRNKGVSVGVSTFLMTRRSVTSTGGGNQMRA